MEIANVRVRLSKDGSDVPKNDVTPAEAMFLHILHQANNGGLTFGDEFKHIKVIGQAMVQEGEKLRPRTDAEELRRLANKYNQARNKKNEPIINEVWPDKFNPKLPQTFKDIPWATASASGIEPAAVNYATGQVMSEPVAASKGK